MSLYAMSPRAAKNVTASSNNYYVLFVFSQFSLSLSLSLLDILVSHEARRL